MGKTTCERIWRVDDCGDLGRLSREKSARIFLHNLDSSNSPPPSSSMLGPFPTPLLLLGELNNFFLLLFLLLFLFASKN
jgi:hypothetical protein